MERICSEPLPLDEAMVQILNFPRNGPLMIKGNAPEGDERKQHLVSRRRPARVRLTLSAGFICGPTYVGIVPLGAALANLEGAGQSHKGIRLLSYCK